MSSPEPNGLARLRAFPRASAPNDDPKAVKSNLREEDVVLCQNILAYHIGHHPGSNVFGNAQAKGLKLVEMYVRSRGQAATDSQKPEAKLDDLEAVTVCELTVEENMLNVHGTFAGACATLILDLATFSSLFALSPVTGTDASGVSTSMNIIWHAPAVRGMTLRFVATALSFKGRMASARCEVYDKKRGTLLISATHVVAPVRGLPTRGSRGEKTTPKTRAPPKL